MRSTSLPRGCAVVRPVRSKDRLERPECRDEAGCRSPTGVACWRPSRHPNNAYLRFRREENQAAVQRLPRDAPNVWVFGIEINEIAGPRVDLADAQAGVARIETIENRQVVRAWP